MAKGHDTLAELGHKRLCGGSLDGRRNPHIDFLFVAFGTILHVTSLPHCGKPDSSNEASRHLVYRLGWWWRLMMSCYVVGW